MNLLKKPASLLLIATTLFTAACKKDISSNVDPLAPAIALDTVSDLSIESVAATPKISRIDQDAKNYWVFTYNTDGLIAGYTNLSDGQKLVATATYSSNKKPASVKLGDAVYKFHYKGTVIDKVEIYADKKHPAVVTAYTANSYTENKLTEVTLYGMIDAKNFIAITRTTSEYTSAGDVKTQKVYIYNYLTKKLVLASTTVYEYDNKNNPVYALGDLANLIFQVQSVHNVTKQTDYDAKNKVTSTVTTAYLYNSKNYPTQATQKTVVPPNTKGFTSVQKYTYK